MCTCLHVVKTYAWSCCSEYVTLCMEDPVTYQEAENLKLNGILH